MKVISQHTFMQTLISSNMGFSENPKKQEKNMPP